MEEKDNNKPKPGYLGKNLEGHEEVYSPNAWFEIESKLKDKNRKRPFFWWFTSLGIILVGLSGILLWINKKDSNKESIIATSNSQTRTEKINVKSLSKESTSGTQGLEKAQIETHKNESKIAGSNKKKLNAGNEGQFQNAVSKSHKSETLKDHKLPESKPVDQKFTAHQETQIEKSKQKLTANRSLENKNVNLESNKKPGSIIPEAKLKNSSSAEQTNFSANDSEQNQTAGNKKVRRATRGKSLLINSDKASISSSESVEKNTTLSPKKRNRSQNRILKYQSKTNLLAENNKNRKPAPVRLLEQKEIKESSTTPEIEKSKQGKQAENQIITNEIIDAKPIDENPNKVLNSNKTNQIPTADQAKQTDPKVEPTLKNKVDSSLVNVDSILSKASDLKPTASITNIDFKPPPTPSNDFKKQGFWLISVESGSMTQEASVAQNQSADYKYLRFQLNNSKIGTPVFSSLRINHLWQIHSTLAIGFRVSYSLVHQKINTSLEPAKFAPSVYTYGKDSNSITAVAVSQNSQTTFSRNSHMIDPGLYAQYKPNWSPIGIQLAAQWIGFNINTDKNILSGSMYKNFQIHSGLFFPFRNRFQLMANTFFLKSEDYFLPIPVLSKGNGWVGTLGIGMKW